MLVFLKQGFGACFLSLQKQRRGAKCDGASDSSVVFLLVFYKAQGLELSLLVAELLGVSLGLQPMIF